MIESTIKFLFKVTKLDLKVGRTWTSFLHFTNFFFIILSPLETFLGLHAATNNNSPKFYYNPMNGLETHTQPTDMDFYKS